MLIPFKNSEELGMNEKKENLRKISSLAYYFKHGDYLQKLQEAYPNDPPYNKDYFVKLHKFNLAKPDYNKYLLEQMLATLHARRNDNNSSISNKISSGKVKFDRAQKNLYIAEFKNKGVLKLEIAVL